MAKRSSKARQIPAKWQALDLHSCAQVKESGRQQIGAIPLNRWTQECLLPLSLPTKPPNFPAHPWLSPPVEVHVRGTSWKSGC